MLVRIGLLTVLFFVPLGFPHPIVWAENSEPNGPLSLQECYQLALKRSETLQISADEIKIAEAQYQQALSNLYPNVDLLGSQRYRNSEDFGRLAKSGGSSEDNFNGSGGSGGSIGRSQLESTVRLSQPLFHGFREFLLSRAYELRLEAQSEDYTRARELMYLDVSSLYYQILLDKADVATLEESEKTLIARLKELREFVGLGKSRESEVLAAESELADAAALKESKKGAVNASLELLAFLTGVPSRQLKIQDVSSIPALQPVDQYLEQALKRADLKAAKFNLEAADKELKAANREGWPNLDLNANGYLVDDPDRQRDWDLSLDLSFPIFDGGEISARQVEAAARRNQTSLSAIRLLRLVEREIRTTHARSTALFAEYMSLQKLVISTRKNYEVQRRDYGLGVVTNLDVLLSIRRLHDAEIRASDAKYNLLSRMAELEVATGGIAQ